MMKNMAVIKTIKKDGKLKGGLFFFFKKTQTTIYIHLFSAITLDQGFFLLPGTLSS